jgi:hypothetical protein
MSEHGPGGDAEEGGDEGRGREGDRQAEHDADALAQGRTALREGEAQPGDDDGDDAHRLGDRTGERVRDRLQRGLPGHGRAAGRAGDGRDREGKRDKGAQRKGLDSNGEAANLTDRSTGHWDLTCEARDSRASLRNAATIDRSSSILGYYYVTQRFTFLLPFKLDGGYAMTDYRAQRLRT